MLKRLSLFYCLGFLILIFCLFYYQILNGTYYERRAKNNYIRLTPISALRGNIYDRRGNIIAQDKPAYNIAVLPYKIKNKKDFLFNKLASLSHFSKESLLKNYRKNLKNYFTPVKIMENIDKREGFFLYTQLPQYLIIFPSPQRYYQYSYEFSHITGYVKPFSQAPNFRKYGYSPSERVGIGGVEQFYNDYLKGEDGGYSLELNSQGKIVGFLGEKLPKRGEDIFLTIDKEIQKIAYKKLSSYCQKHNTRGTIILMDARNGGILSLVSYPSFDPNRFIQSKNLGKILNNRNFPLINRAIQGYYPPGSVFKPIVAIAALAEKKISSSTVFVCNGEYNLGPRKFHCWSKHGKENLIQAIAHSCNVYFYHLGLLLGAKSINRWAKIFGLDKLTGIDLAFEKRGIIPSPLWKKTKYNQDWFPGDTLNFSIGQGYLAITPLEAIRAINTIAREGVMVKPHLIKRIGNKSYQHLEKRINLPEEIFSAVKRGMKEVVNSENGTARALKMLNLKLAGKTGTAQTASKPHGWFLGYFPYDKPRYTICVLLENAGSSFEAVKLTYFFLKKLKEMELISIN